MAPDPALRDKQLMSDTTKTAPLRLMLWIVPLAIAAFAIVLLGVHFTGGIK